MEKSNEIDLIRQRFADRTMSDHLMLLNIYREWRKQRNSREKSDFCFEYFLNLNHMKMLDKVRQQLKQLIEDFFGFPTGRREKKTSNRKTFSFRFCK